MNLVELGGDQAQSGGTPHGMRQSERAPSSNNLTSPGSSSVMSLLNDLPSLGNPTSKKDPEKLEADNISMNLKIPMIADHRHLQRG